MGIGLVGGVWVWLCWGGLWSFFFWLVEPYVVESGAQY